jgi:gliding motility-associated-like protein
MIKQFFIIYLLLFYTLIYAQVNPGATCGQAGCSTSGTYTSLTGTASIGGYSCLGSTPNANWLALGISTNGSIHLTLTQIGNGGFPIDVDFALYGPFTSVSNGCPILSNLNAVDCSFSGSNTEFVDIANAVAGQVYILLTTNFGGGSGTITLAQNANLPSTGSINCNINFTATVAKTGAACFFSNGSATVTPSGGYPPYTYLWNTPGNPTTPSVSNLAAGTYSVTINSSSSPITNQNFNPVSISVTIPTITATYSSSSTPAFCSTSNTGTATATFNMQNGNTGLTATYVWNDPLGQTTSTATGLLPGTYICSITLSNGCTGTTSVTVGTQPAMLLTQTSNTPVSCFSGTNGAVAVAVTNGTAPYSYLWSTSATTSSLSNLAEGTYTLQVTDANSCIKNGSFTILQPAILDGNFTSISNFNGVNISCYNGNNGAATITGSGGVGPYTYLWNNGSTLSSQTNLIAGNNTVTITDSKTCTLQKNIVMTQPDEIDLSETHQNISCYNGNNGNINLTVSGGTAPYIYSWSNNLSSQNLLNITAGTYTVIVTDANGCSKNLSVTLTQPLAPLSSSDTHTDILCKGFSTGAIDLTVIGGTSPYTYLWSNGQTTQDIDTLLSGTYSVSITDAKSCVFNDTIFLTQPLNLLSYTSVSTPINCFGFATGAINISPAGGTAPYTFVWTNSATTEDISSLLTGNYQVTITDANMCVLTSDTINIPQPLAPIVLTGLIDTVNCFNGSDGAINLTVTGGTAPYTYSWSNGQTSQDIDSLISGNYTVIVSDVKGCSDTLILNVSQPLAPINTSGIKVNVLCKGFSTGAIDLSLTGGTTPYSYLWSNGQTTQDIDSLLSGTYSVVISDFNGCFFYDTLQISEPLNSLSYTSITTLINCFGDATGAINISPAGGTAPYSFAWTNSSITEDISSLLTGNYLVTITDANMCVLTSDTINIPQPLVPISLTAIIDAVKCHNGSDGAINLSVTGGTSPYTYSWSNGQLSQDIDSLNLGNYEVIVSDSKGCMDSSTYQVTQPVMPLTLGITHTDALCVGGTQGTIDLTVTGGTTPYTYLWNNFKTTPDLDSLFQGFYYVLVTDANGCNDTISATVLDPNNSMILSIVKTDVQCFSGSDGTVNLAVQYGTPGFSYLWNNGATTQDLSNLPIGTYAVNVTDTNTCGAFISIVINQPATPVSGSISSIDVLCKTFATGSIDLTNGGGIAPYTYLWNNNQLTQDLQNLTAGIYTVTIKDSHNCILVLSDTIFEPATVVSASESHINVKCFSNSTGSINITPSGGVGNYSFQWLSSETTEDIDSLIAGNYFVTIKDGNNCTFPVTVAITQPLAALSLATSITNVSCFGGINGVIDLTPSGGTSPYTYFWSDSTTNQDLVNYPFGTYSVIVTDTNNCIDSIVGTITQPTLLVINGSTTPVICHGDATGTVTVVANGGTPGYSYLWSNGDQNALNDSILTGTYSVLVTDNLGCKDSLSIFVKEPTLLTSSTTHIDNPCYGDAVGSVSVVAAGGITPYTYLWNNTALTPTTSNLIAGVYTIIVKDSNNCIINDTSEVLQPLAPLNIDFVTSDVLCFNGTTGAIDASTSGGTIPYAFSWNTTAVSEDLTNLPIGIYTLTVTDVNNCVLVKTDTIIEPALLDTSNVILDDISCNGFSDGSINITTVGGVTPYSFAWSNSTTNEDLTNVPIGTYSLTITDAHLCVSQYTYTLNQPLPLIATYTTIPPLCYSYSDGSITLNTTGGTTPYAYSWTNGSTSAINSGIVTGNYTATITDAQNCVFVLPCFIDQPAQIQVSFNVSDTVGCDPTTIEFTNTSDEQFISTWQFGDGNSATGNNNIENTYISPGCFDVSLTVESPIGCTNSVVYPSIICINPTPTAGISANPTTLDTSNPETEITNTTTGAVSYEWDMGDNGLYNFFQPGLYTYPMYTLNEFLITLTATSDKGCVDTAQYTIFFDNSLIFYVPNTFTPDGNEYNNVFKPILTSLVAEYQMQIYNRWGELIFESFDKEVGWDGSYKGGIIQNGAYNWVIKIKTDGTQTHVKRGNVLLLR